MSRVAALITVALVLCNGCGLASARVRALDASCGSGAPIADAAEYQPGPGVHHIAILTQAPGMSGIPGVEWEEIYESEVQTYQRYPPGWQADLSETELVACLGAGRGVQLRAARTGEIIEDRADDGSQLTDWLGEYVEP